MVLGNPLVSVIVPAYNTASVLLECVESILGQTYPRIEVIVVDDGSTDGTAGLCESLVARDQRIKVFHGKNRGQAFARNLGVKKSKGEYIAFVDSDDVVAPIFIEALMEAIKENGTQIATLPFGRRFETKRPDLIECMELCPKATVMSELEIQKSLLYQAMDTGPVWRICKREIVERCPFPEGLVYEDLGAVYKMYQGAGAVAVVDTFDLYAYRDRRESTINSEYTQRKSKSAIEISRRLYKDIIEAYPSLSCAASSRCFSVNRMVYAQIPYANKTDRLAVWNELAKYNQVVLKDLEARKRERFAALLSIMGERIFFVACYIARKLKLLR